MRRKSEREFELHAQSVDDTLGILAQAGIGHGGRERMALSAEQSLLRMQKVAGMDLLKEDGAARGERIAQLRNRLGDLMNDAAPVASPLMRMHEPQRKAYEQFFELVYDCSTNRVAAKALIDRILLRLE